ncbi:MAG: phosphate ABC transporter permease family protein, partial [Pseudomonadota bacterium]|nr:phosphate ABC transporter permease family protein [Pseudomonadota bacterium]
MSIGIVLLALSALSVTTFVLARRKVTAGGARLHSLPGYHGGFVALWTGLPAFLLLAGLALFGDRLRDGAIETYAPALVLVLAVAGALWAYPKVRPEFRARNNVERWIAGLLIACSGVAVLTTLGIVLSLLLESARFFSAVSPLEFLFGTQWSPQTAMRADQVGSSGAFGAVPLFVGTFLIMLIAMAV